MRRRESGNEDLEKLVLEAVEEATQSVKQMRKIEGNALEKDIRTHLMCIQDIVRELTKIAPTVVEFIKIDSRKEFMSLLVVKLMKHVF